MVGFMKQNNVVRKKCSIALFGNINSIDISLYNPNPPQATINVTKIYIMKAIQKLKNNMIKKEDKNERNQCSKSFRCIK